MEWEDGSRGLVFKDCGRRDVSLMNWGVTGPCGTCLMLGRVSIQLKVEMVVEVRLFSFLPTMSID